jgi:hypothetical protein
VSLVVALATLAGAAVVFAASGTGTGVIPASSASDARLPDLDVTIPSGLVVQRVAGVSRPRFLLGFVSAAGNIGDGPLIVRGERTSLGEETMTAEQVIRLADGETVTKPDVGWFEYVVDPSHQHWHLLPFMRYELRRESDNKLVTRDQKTGFCLGDRYNLDPSSQLPGEPENREWATNCGPGQTELLGLEEGISVGWGDVYEAWRDGQYLDVTEVKAGRYYLVHRVNQGRPLEESNYANNASAVLISITWPKGKTEPPRIRVLRSCPDTARCRPRPR